MYLGTGAKGVFIALVMIFFGMVKAAPIPTTLIAGLTGSAGNDTGQLSQTASYTSANGQASANVSIAPNSFDEGGLTLLLSASATGTSENGNVSGFVSAKFYFELFGPVIYPNYEVDLINVTHYAVTHTGNSLYIYDNCYGQPTEACNTYNYSYTELLINSQGTCNGIQSQAGDIPCQGGFPQPRVTSLNTPYEVDLSALAVASGVASASVNAEINITIFPTGLPGQIFDPSDYQLVFGPTIASLTVTTVAEPSSILIFVLGFGIVLMCRYRDNCFNAVENTFQAYP